ncbi:hypothetical protein CVT25_008980 [Psilocybe cyanescens]|uniref:F-box domain-containing protein n=1 Tax=Psilocybe cyanescens TaxID=93625 RepID=A0A409XNE2_PSICY|nr:hypothetical protein CVT25_008980 [Psilocybe cyanescens]
MPSRPKRKSKPTNASTVDVSPSDAVVQTDGESDLEPPKKRQKKAKGTAAKRKVNVADKARLLPSLNAMPLDIFYEICETLEPLDVLHLSWTSIYIHNTLMDKNATSALWKKSRSLIVGLPECPNDLNEAQYAHLMFGKDCYCCLKKPRDLHTIWAGRFRACSSCVESTYSPDIIGHRDGSLSKLENFLPMIRICPKKQRYTRNYYCIKTYEAWKEEYTAAENKSEWVHEKIKERTIIEEHAQQCSTWARSWAEQLPARSKAKVVERIKALGWGSEFDKIFYEGQKPQNLEKITKACQKELTERNLLRLEPYINQYMGAIQRKRLQSEYSSFIRKVVPVLKDIIDTCTVALPPNALVPTAGDLVYLPIVQDILNDTTQYRSFKPETDLEFLRESFSDIVAQWQHDVEVRLHDLIRSACGQGYEFDPKTILHLATTAFCCTRCNNMHAEGASIWYPRIPIHTHSTTDIDWQLLDKMSNESVIWNYKEFIIFREEDMLSLSKVLTQFGFDPKVTTAGQMDAADLIFECVTCNSQNVGRCTMRWRALAAHINKAHNESGTSTFKLQLLEGTEAEYVKNRLDETTGRMRAEPYRYERPDSKICVHCKKTGNVVSIATHVRGVHGIARPTEADMVLSLDADSTHFHRLWPPREEQDDEILT